MYIPFKYFDVIFDDESFGKLIYNFPLVEEVMVEIYNSQQKQMTANRHMVRKNRAH